MNEILPNKPSELILLALKDLEACEAHPGYKIDMGDWHAPEDGVCYVCLAGAVMAQTFEMSPRRDITPSAMDSRSDTKALRALNSFREGRLKDGEAWLNIPASGCPSMVIPKYDKGPEEFKKAMRGVAAYYTSRGY